MHTCITWVSISSICCNCSRIDDTLSILCEIYTKAYVCTTYNNIIPRISHLLWIMVFSYVSISIIHRIYTNYVQVGICDTKFLVMLWHSGAAKFSKLEVHNITLIEQLTVLLEYINVSISGTGHTKHLGMAEHTSWTGTFYPSSPTPWLCQCIVMFKATGIV